LRETFRAVDRAPSRYADGISTRGHFGGLGGRLKAAEVDAVFERIELEPDPHRLLRLTWVLCSPRTNKPKRPSPRLLRVARTGSGYLRKAAIDALSLCKHESVVELGRELIGRGGLPEAAALFRWSCTPADEQLLVTAGLRLRRPNEVHPFWMSVRRVVEEHRGLGFGPLLLAMYERVPCAHCRSGVLEELLERGAAPRAMLEEAAWDSYQESRSLARRALRGG
jgi:hypothetical protein